MLFFVVTYFPLCIIMVQTSSMNRLILYVCLVFYGFIKSQNAATVDDFLHDNYFKRNYPWMENFTGNKKIKEINFKELVKGKDSTFFYFNERGFLLKAVYAHYFENNTRQSRTDIHEYRYNSSDDLIEVKHFDKNHQLKYSGAWSYHSHRQLNSSQKSIKGTPVKETIYFYNADSTLAKNENFNYKRGQKHLKSYYQYTYAPGKKLKATFFYRKNKLRHTWSFNCDDRGKIVKKDTTNICTSEGHDNKGRKIITQHYTEGKKNEFKTVTYYKIVNNNEFPNEFQNYKVKKDKEILFYKIHYPDSLEPFYRYTLYNSKGIVLFEEITNYYTYTQILKSLKSKTRNSYNRNGQLCYNSSEMFDEKGLPTLCRITGRKDKEYKKIEYVFVSPIEITINHYHKNKLKRSYRASLSFY